MRQLPWSITTMMSLLPLQTKDCLEMEEPWIQTSTKQEQLQQDDITREGFAMLDCNLEA